MATGEKIVGEDTPTVHSARVTNEAPITVRGEAKVRVRPSLALQPNRLGASRVKLAWQPVGSLLATASSNEEGLLLQIYDSAGVRSAKLRSAV